jgi:hypothetical protein
MKHTVVRLPESTSRGTVKVKLYQQGAAPRAGSKPRGKATAWSDDNRPRFPAHLARAERAPLFNHACAEIVRSSIDALLADGFDPVKTTVSFRSLAELLAPLRVAILWDRDRIEALEASAFRSTDKDRTPAGKDPRPLSRSHKAAPVTSPRGRVRQ